MAGPHLVAQLIDGGGRWPDPDEPGVDHGLGELGVLGEETVTGVHSVSAGPLSDVQEFFDVQVGVRRGCTVQGECLVGQLHEEGTGVRVGVDRHGVDARVASRPDHADGDLTPVGDQDLRDGASTHEKFLLA